MKKFLSVLLAACLCLSLAACGNAKDGAKTNAKSNFDVPAGGYDGSDVTIKFYHTMGSNLTDVLNIYI